MSLHLSQSLRDIFREEHVVRDRGDLLCFLPGFLEKVQLPLECASFRILMRYHFECKTKLGREQREDRSLSVHIPTPFCHRETSCSLERHCRILCSVARTTASLICLEEA